MSGEIYKPAARGGDTTSCYILSFITKSSTIHVVRVHLQTAGHPDTKWNQENKMQQVQFKVRIDHSQKGDINASEPTLT